jgi:hypothetical protein
VFLEVAVSAWTNNVRIVEGKKKGSEVQLLAWRKKKTGSRVQCGFTFF